MKGKAFLLVSVLLIVVLINLTVVYSIYDIFFKVKFEVLPWDDIAVEFYSEEGIFEKGEKEYISKKLAIDEKKAVEIAHLYLKDYTDEKYEVYFDEENERYMITANYTVGAKWYHFSRLEDYEHFGYWEPECVIVIDKNTGEVINVQFFVY